MNPFLDPTRAEPRPGMFRLRGARRRVGAMALALGVAAAMPAQAAVDVNNATQSQLEGVRGIGPKTAAAIVEARRQGGAFRSFEDLGGRVRGLGDKRMRKLKAAGLAVGGAAGGAAGTGPAGLGAQPEVMVNVPGRRRDKGG